MSMIPCDIHSRFTNKTHILNKIWQFVRFTRTLIKYDPPQKRIVNGSINFCVIYFQTLPNANINRMLFCKNDQRGSCPQEKSALPRRVLLFVLRAGHFHG